MTNNKEREFEEIMDKIFGTEPSRYSAWNKELFLQMFNEAYAKGRQSALGKYPSDNQIRKKRLEIAKEFFEHFDGEGNMRDAMEDLDTEAGIAAASAHDGANRMGAWLSEKLSDDKGV